MLLHVSWKYHYGDMNTGGMDSDTAGAGVCDMGNDVAVLLYSGNVQSAVITTRQGAATRVTSCRIIPKK